MTTTNEERYLFSLPEVPSVAIDGSSTRFPVSRIFCVARNYAEHAREMGNEIDREAPFYFLKQAGAVVPSGATIAYAPGTRNLHHEVELVVAIGASAWSVDPETAMGAVWGYACGLDMTRRDLQAAAKEKGRPWDFAKNFEESAPIGALVAREQFGEPGDRSIRLAIGGDLRQEARLSDMVWSVGELISHLSHYYHLVPGDLIFSGTPAGVGPVRVGDRLAAEIEGLPPLEVTIGPAEGAPTPVAGRTVSA